jgi:hypothetical protein
MADIENLGLTDDQDDYASESSSLAPWQQFIRRWQGPIAFGPFAVFILMTFKFFANSPANWLFMALLIGLPGWAVAVVGYALYLKYID